MGKKLARFFIVVFIVADAYFIWQYTKGMGLNIIEAITLSIVVAAILDSASYFASSFGLTALLEIPFIDKPQIKKDIIRYSTVLLTVGLIVICGQVFLVNYRANQISDKKMALTMERAEYDARMSAIDNNDSLSSINKEREKSRIPKAVYDGNEIIDYISLIVPIITTILSFALGLIGGKKYDKFEKEKVILKQKKDEINRQIEEMLSNYEINKGILLRAAEGKRLDENITSKKLSEEKDEILNMIENNLRKGVPDIYKSNINALVSAFEKEVIEIKQNLSKDAEDNTLILNFDYKNEDGLNDEIAKLEVLNDKIIRV